jgi:hypothetical protein
MPYADREKERQTKHDRYLEKKQDPEFLAKQKKYRDEHAEKNREYQRSYRVENAEQLRLLKERRKAMWKSSAKEYQREYARQYAAKYRNEVLKMYGGKCECCGESTPEFMEIDHKNNDGAQHRKECQGGHAFYKWLVKNGCPREQFRLLCSNCNNCRGRYGYCPHEKQRSLPENQFLSEGGQTTAPPI